MNEREFWQELQFLLNSQAAPPMPGWYCDWLEPKKYILGGRSPRIRGRVGFVNGRHARNWEFVLVLNQSAEQLTEIDWDSMLPPDDATDWFHVDEFRQSLELDPAAAKVNELPDKGAEDRRS